MANRPDETYGRPVKQKKTDGLTIPAGFPGQLGLLAQQMNNGFGGGLLAQRAYLNSIYDPIKMTPMPTFGDDAKTSDDKTTTTTTGTPEKLDWNALLRDPELFMNREKLAAFQDWYAQNGGRGGPMR